MKLRTAIPVVLAIVGLSAFQAKAIEVNVGQPPVGPAANPGTNVDLPGVGVHVNTVPVAPPVNVQAAAPVADPIVENRADRWRYKQYNNQWWYWAPDNRWMIYSNPGGWTYYQPGAYTTGYGGVTVTPGTTYAVPSTTYPSTDYYYGYPSYYYGYGYPSYYYGRPGIYIGGGWGGRGWGGRGWR